MSRKLQRVERGAPAVLRPPEEIAAERAAERAEQLAIFRAYFETVPGWEWEEGSTDGLLLYCRFYAVPDHPEWGKAFTTYRLDRPEALRWLREDIEKPSRSPPLEWNAWAHLGFKGPVSREELIARFHEMTAKEEKEQRWTYAAYHRCLNDLWITAHPTTQLHRGPPKRRKSVGRPTGEK